MAITHSDGLCESVILLIDFENLKHQLGNTFYVSKESAQRKTVDYYGLRHRSLYLALYALGDV